MTYDEFCTRILSAVRDKLGSGHDVFLQRVEKNNGVILDGLCDRTGTSHISPTLYLRDFYIQDCGRNDIDAISARIASVFMLHSPDLPCAANDLLNFDRLKDHIFLKLINAPANQSRLNKLPHVRVLDLAIICYVCLPGKTGRQYSFVADRSHLAKWGIPEAELLRLAQKNTLSGLPPVIRPIQDFLPPELFKKLPSDDPTMSIHVVSNHTGQLGAVSVLLDGVLRDFSHEKNLSELILIPSSIHEFLIVSASAVLSDLEDLCSMVRSVNLEEVCEEERLSDHIYIYRADTDTLSSWPASSQCQDFSPSALSGLLPARVSD